MARGEYRLTPAGTGRRRRPATPLIASLVVHLLVLLVWRVEVRLSAPAGTEPRLFVLAPGPTEPRRRIDLPPPPRESPVVRSAAPRTERAGPPSAARPPRAARDVPSPDRAAAPAAPGGVAADTGARAARGGQLRPSYGDGRLWVEPYPETPQALAERVRRSHGDLVDSAVTAIVQAYLDSLALEPGADRAQLPSWVANVGGRQFGLDSKYVYIAGLKIPAAVLALIPFPQGNVDQALANRRLQDLRSDLLQAAQRAENAAEFKRAIRDIRERKKAEEEFERNRRTPPGQETE